MTERTVTVQTEQEETVALCDYCGLDEDDAPEKGTLHRYYADNTTPALHYHSACLDEMTNAEFSQPRGEYIDENGRYSHHNTIVAPSSLEIGFFAVGVVAAIVFGFGVGAGDMFASVIGGAASFIPICIAFRLSRAHAKEVVYE
jgi:hypothetical protein